MKYVYLLQHTYQYGENDEHNETKTIGIYESEDMVQETILHYKQLPGFRDFTDDCFVVDKYELNKGEWSEGFLEAD